jgi:hypothetical protein
VVSWFGQRPDVEPASEARSGKPNGRSTNNATGKRPISNILIFAMFLVVTATLIVYVEPWIVKPEVSVLLDKGVMSDAQKAATGQVIELGKLMINWSIAAIGAIAVSVSRISKMIDTHAIIAKITLGLSFFIFIISIWLGLVVFDIAINSLAMEQDPLKSDTLNWCRKWQYLLFVYALVVFMSSWTMVALYSDETTGERK